VRRNAIVGSIVWCGLLASTLIHLFELAWIELLFLFAPLLIVPLGIILTDRLDGPPAAVSLAERVGRRIQLPAALLAAVSFLFEPGILAAALVVPWLAVCVFFALGGAVRIGRGAYARLEDFSTAVAFFYLAIGGAWLFASRLGATPFSFNEPLVLLTAVHFHYAGFAAPLLARSVLGVLSQPSRPSGGAVLSRIVTMGVLAGPGALALGFVVGPGLRLTAALILATSEIGLAVCFILTLGQASRLSVEILLTLAAASVAFSMAFAAVWAIGSYPLEPFVHLGEMETFHGTANAFGFALCGLLGSILAAQRETRQPQAQP
jgi:YndJ-like protein